MTDVPVPPDPSREPPRRTITLPAGQRRLPPRWEGTVGAVGGLVVATGVFVLMGEVPDDATRPLAILLSAALLVGGLVTLARGGERRALWGAGVSAALVAAAPLAFLIVLDPESSDAGTGDATLVLLLAAVAWGVLYFVGPARGAAVLLGAALAAVWLLALVQTTPDPDQLSPFGLFVPEFEEDTTFEEDPSFDEDTFDEDTTFEEDAGEFGGFEEPDPYDPGDTAVLSLLIGAAFVGVGAALDRRPAAAVATPFFVVGDLALALGIVAFGADTGATAGGFLALAAGAVVAWIGARGARRFTTWLAGVGVFSGVVTLVVEIVGEENELPGALVLMAVGAAVVWASYALGARVDADVAPPAEAPPAS